MLDNRVKTRTRILGSKVIQVFNIFVNCKKLLNTPMRSILWRVLPVFINVFYGFGVISMYLMHIEQIFEHGLRYRSSFMVHFWFNAQHPYTYISIYTIKHLNQAPISVALNPLCHNLYKSFAELFSFPDGNFLPVVILQLSLCSMIASRIVSIATCKRCPFLFKSD